MVYVLDINGKPLMPTERHGKVRRLLKERKAKAVKKTPFTTRIIHAFFTKPFFRVLSSKCKQIFLDSVIHIVSGGGGYLIFSKMTGKNWSKSHITSFCA